MFVGRKMEISLGSFKKVSLQVRPVRSEEPDPLRQRFLKLQEPPQVVRFNQYRESMFEDLSDEHENINIS